MGEETEIGIDDALHVLTLMVEVAHTVPSFAGIVVGAQRIAILRGPSLGLAAIVIGADIGRCHLIGLTVVGLLGEVHPAVQVPAVVDDYIGNGAEACSLEGVDHRAQLFLVAKGAVVVVEPPQVVVSHRLRTAVTALGNPDEVEGGGKVASLFLKGRPLRIGEGIPVEALQHHTRIVLWPALRMDY